RHRLPQRRDERGLSLPLGKGHGAPMEEESGAAGEEWGHGPMAARAAASYLESTVTPAERFSMPTTTVSIATRARTWLFVAGLTALLIAAGALVGGAFLYVFVALAVLMNVGGYWFSDRLALAASRARPLGGTEAPGLQAAVAELAQRAGIPVPRLYLIPSEQPNAFATGRNPARSAVAVTHGLLERMPAEQVRAVVAHELGHIRNRDVLVASIAATIAGAIAAIANVVQFSFLFGGQDDEDQGPLGCSARSRRCCWRRSRRCCSSSRSHASASTSQTRPPRGCSAAAGRSRTRSRRSSAGRRWRRW